MNKPTLMLVDDLPENLNILYQVLKDEYDVRCATSGYEALKAAETIQPDLIILDVMMPEIDGFETCRKLKQKEALQDVPVIFLTALTDDVDEMRGFEAGAVDYIFKPIKPMLVKKRVETHLSLRQKTLQLMQNKRELEESLSRINVLSGLVPICMYCKKIRDDEGYWNKLETYISQHSDILFSHGACPECTEKALEEIKGYKNI